MATIIFVLMIIILLSVFALHKQPKIQPQIIEINKRSSPPRR